MMIMVILILFHGQWAKPTEVGLVHLDSWNKILMVFVSTPTKNTKTINTMMIMRILILFYGQWAKPTEVDLVHLDSWNKILMVFVSTPTKYIMIIFTHL